MNRLFAALLAPWLLLAPALPALAQAPGPQAPVAATRSGVQPPAAAPSAVPEKIGPAAVTPAITRVDINSATLAVLDTLPGVGDARAQGIVANRPYLTKRDLVTKKVLPSNVFRDVEPRIALVNINTASADDMAKILTRIGPVRAAAIVKGRPYATPDELVTKGVLTPGLFKGIQGLVTAG